MHYYDRSFIFLNAYLGHTAKNSGQIEKTHSGSLYELDPPLWDLSRESWGARSEPLPKIYILSCDNLRFRPSQSQ
jgi:hypothetical protein